MNRILACALAATLMAPATSFAQQKAEVGKVYICTVAQMQNDVGLCANVSLPSPPEDLCVRIAEENRYQVSRVILTEDDRRACPVPAAFIAATGAAATNVVPAVIALGGLGGAGAAAAAVAAAGALAAASGGGSSNGTTN